MIINDGKGLDKSWKSKKSGWMGEWLLEHADAAWRGIVVRDFMRGAGRRSRSWAGCDMRSSPLTLLWRDWGLTVNVMGDDLLGLKMWVRNVRWERSPSRMSSTNTTPVFSSKSDGSGIKMLVCSRSSSRIKSVNDQFRITVNWLFMIINWSDHLDWCERRRLVWQRSSREESGFRWWERDKKRIINLKSISKKWISWWHTKVKVFLRSEREKERIPVAKRHRLKQEKWSLTHELKGRKRSRGFYSSHHPDQDPFLLILLIQNRDRQTVWFPQTFLFIHSIFNYFTWFSICSFLTEWRGWRWRSRIIVAKKENPFNLNSKHSKAFTFCLLLWIHILIPKPAVIVSPTVSHHLHQEDFLKYRTTLHFAITRRLPPHHDQRPYLHNK